jgi:hypothetical protein
MKNNPPLKNIGNKKRCKVYKGKDATLEVNGSTIEPPNQPDFVEYGKNQLLALTKMIELEQAAIIRLDKTRDIGQGHTTYTFEVIVPHTSAIR